MIIGLGAATVVAMILFARSDRAINKVGTLVLYGVLAAFVFVELGVISS